MGFVNMGKLPKWGGSSRITVRSRLPPGAPMRQVKALSQIIEIGREYGIDTPNSRTKPMLSVVQGTYAHRCLKQQLGRMPQEYQCQVLRIEVPTPALPTLGAESGTHSLEAMLVLWRGRISQIHLLVCHGSMGSFPSPGNEARFHGGCGIVSHSSAVATLRYPGKADVQDFGINLAVMASGQIVPKDQIDIYARNNLLNVPGLATLPGAYGFTALMQVARVGDKFGNTHFADLPEHAQSWIRSAGLEGVPDLDPSDSRPYMSRVWSMHQTGLKQRSE